MNLPYSDGLDIQYLSRIFDNMTECYKLFWFQAIVDAVVNGKETVSYDELINHMIVDAWYMVSEYRLNLGPKDTLEELVHYAYKLSGFKSCEKQLKILEFLQNCQDKELSSMKIILTRNVPYRLQAPFMPNFKGAAWNAAFDNIAAQINKHPNLLYYFMSGNGLKRQIRFNKDWMDYILANQVIIKGWIQCNMILYLQRRNHSVPGIANKIHPPVERNLEKVKKYWKMIVTLKPIHDIYGDIKLTTIFQSIILYHGHMLHMMSFGIFIQQPEVLIVVRVILCQIGRCILINWEILNTKHIRWYRIMKQFIVSLISV